METSTNESAPGSRKRSAPTATPEEDASADANSCPYLDTIERSLLDFDLEPSCSVTLESGPHIYCCLVCGKFFRGRGPRTPAYTHSAEESHFCFLHLDQGRFYCLPDNYEIHDASLQDIRNALHPRFSEEKIQQMDARTELARDLFGRRYLPGYVGLNNLGKTDYLNAVLQALAHVRPLRNFFLCIGPGTRTISVDEGHHKKGKSAPIMSPLALYFGATMRKMWSDQRFKSHVDPHLLLHEISVQSKKKYHMGRQAEAGEFLAWLLHQLHVGLGGTRKAGSSIVHKVFQGQVQVTTRQRKPVVQKPPEEEDDREGSDHEDQEATGQQQEPQQKFLMEDTTTDTHFLQLTLDIPEKPLFKDEEGGLVIPQEPLVNVLKKFDGMNFTDALGRGGIPQKRLYKLRQLPPYLILVLGRFKSNAFTREKNPTIVAFPVKNLDLSPYVFPTGGRPVPPTADQVRNMGVRELKELLARYGRQDLAKGVTEKSELVEATLNFVTQSLPDLIADKYDLVANITHDSPPEVGREGLTDPLEEGSYKCHVHHKAANQWYEIQDLHVQETMPQLIGLSESYVLIFEKKGIQAT